MKLLRAANKKTCFEKKCLAFLTVGIFQCLIWAIYCLSIWEILYTKSYHRYLSLYIGNKEGTTTDYEGCKLVLKLVVKMVHTLHTSIPNQVR